MIYRIAEPHDAGKGVVGIYPEWGTSGAADARVLHRLHPHNLTVLFTRNHPGAFFQRIASALRQYGPFVDLVCGWELELLRMFFRPLNPNVEVVRLSAMHFNTFDLLREARLQAAGREKVFDLFFAAASRPDGLKNTELLGRLLGGLSRPLRVVGYGRLNDHVLDPIANNPHLDFSWRGKADVSDKGQRLKFLLNMALSRCLLISSRVEGYCRLIGEALFLGVPVLLPAGIVCENWVHLNSRNCQLYVEELFAHCLDDVLRRDWDFPPPEYPDGNDLLRQHIDVYCQRHGLELPQVWYPLRYGALTDCPIDPEGVP